MSIRVIAPGALTTVQDFGRSGHQAEGYPECGACDKHALTLANLLAGNGRAPTLAALEFTLTGPTLAFDEPVLFALAGDLPGARLGGVPLAPYMPVLAKSGDVLETGALASGLRGYVAVYGGIDVPPVLGSRATDLKCHIGGLEGRALKAQDVLPIARAFSLPGKKHTQLIRALTRRPLPEWARFPSTPMRWMGNAGMPLLRVVPGPQQDVFTPRGLEAFARGIFEVSTDSNRMAAKLRGPVIESAHGVDILSDGIVEGSVQVSANGQPIVMLADHQTTGGYAKIGTVIGCDLPRLAQTRPGQRVAFRFVTVEEGLDAYRAEKNKWDILKEQIDDD